MSEFQFPPLAEVRERLEQHSTACGTRAGYEVDACDCDPVNADVWVCAGCGYVLAFRIRPGGDCFHVRNLERAADEGLTIAEMENQFQVKGGGAG